MTVPPSGFVPERPQHVRTTKSQNALLYCPTLRLDVDLWAATEYVVLDPTTKNGWLVDSRFRYVRLVGWATGAPWCEQISRVRALKHSLASRIYLRLTFLRSQRERFNV